MQADKNPKSLWPNIRNMVLDLSGDAPAQILHEQAELLQSETGGKLSALVSSPPDYTRDNENSVRWNFYITSAAFPKYRFRLFTLVQHIEGYPLIVKFDFDVADDAPPVNEEFLWQNKSIRNADEFKAELQRIFSHPRTLKSLATLLSQMNQSA